MVNLAVAYPIFVLVYPFLPCNYTELNVGGGGEKRTQKLRYTGSVFIKNSLLANLVVVLTNSGTRF